MNKGGESLDAALEMIELLMPLAAWRSRAAPRKRAARSKPAKPKKARR
jgi:hypothetical protein